MKKPTETGGKRNGARNAATRNADKGRRPAVDLEHLRRADTADAFMPDPEDGPARIDDDLAENLAEDFLQAATSGEDQDGTHGMVPEEIGGPFIETTGEDEFAAGGGGTQPDGRTPEPRTRRGGGAGAGT